MEQEPIIVLQSDESWLQVESAAQNTVVQIFAQIGKFNWTEPYKSEAQFESRGTGFFINDQGYIVTNAHVVNEAKTIWITIPALGRETIRVEIVSFCPDRDLALLRIVPDDLGKVQKIVGTIPFLPLGNSDLVHRTDKILVLGYPLGQYSIKSTTGVISGREAVNSVSYIQITAPVNPGSSGGPLLLLDGTVIGVTVAVSADAFNVGYAIPIHELKIILEDMLKNKLLRKAVLGAHFHNTNDKTARFLGNSDPGGLYLHKIFKGSLLEKAGVLSGDMIYSINGNMLDAHGQVSIEWTSEKISLYDLISRLPVGKTVNLVLYRQGERKEISFILELQEPYPVRRFFPDYEKVEYEIIGGMVIMPLAQNHLEYLVDRNPYLVRYQKVENMLHPLLVISHVLPGSEAQKLRCLMPGDILKEVNGAPVHTIQQLRETLIKGARGEFLSMKTDDDVLAVFTMKSLLKGEERLSTDFSYSLTPAVRELLDMVDYV